MAEPAPDVVPRDVGFGDLFAAQRVRMVSLAVLLTGSTSVAEEAVQESFARVYERWSTINSPAMFLRTCVVNQCRSWHRRRFVADRKAHLVSPAEAHYDRPDELADALARLPQRRREAIVLRYYERLTIAEIAQTLSVAEGSVKSSLHRGLEQLKGMLS